MKALNRSMRPRDVDLSKPGLPLASRRMAEASAKDSTSLSRWPITRRCAARQSCPL